jgi:uncharacterized protein YfaS (alpha-2-macroglobulin family)
MDEQQVQALLERYFDGATSLAEEEALRRLFAEGNSPPQLEPYSALFAFYAAEQEVVPPAPASSAGTRRWAFAAMAAGIALLLAVKALTPTQSAYTYYVNGRRVHDKEAATALAEAKLQMLADAMQRAKYGMAPLEKLREAGRQLEPLCKIGQMLREADNAIYIAPAAEQRIH